MKILIATVPLAGHVNPALVLAAALVAKGHEVGWYCGNHYKTAIEQSGAQFYPYCQANDFHDATVSTYFPKLPSKNLIKHARYYIKHVFFDNMLPQYYDLLEIIKGFQAEVLFADEWFCGAIPIAEKKILPWVCFSNSPLFYYNETIPFPGSGMMPGSSYIAKQRNKTINYLAEKVFMASTQRYINTLRQSIGLPVMKHFFSIHNIYSATYYIKFNAREFDYPFAALPKQIVFAGPLLATHTKKDHIFIPAANQEKFPVVFITQGAINNLNLGDLIIPAIEAIKEMNAYAIVTTGNTKHTKLLGSYGSDKIIIKDYIPYEQLMPTVDIVITNGGFGSVVTALWHGKPLIIAGKSEDKPVVAALASYFKVGISLGKKSPGKKKIKKAIREIFSQQTYFSNAQEMSRHFRNYDSISTTIDFIEKAGMR